MAQIGSRIEEIRATLLRDEDEIRTLLLEIDDIRAGKWDDKLLQQQNPAAESGANSPPKVLTDPVTAAESTAPLSNVPTETAAKSTPDAAAPTASETKASTGPNTQSDAPAVTETSTSSTVPTAAVSNTQSAAPADTETTNDSVALTGIQTTSEDAAEVNSPVPDQVSVKAPKSEKVIDTPMEETQPLETRTSKLASPSPKSKRSAAVDKPSSPTKVRRTVSTSPKRKGKGVLKSEPVEPMEIDSDIPEKVNGESEHVEPLQKEVKQSKEQLKERKKTPPPKNELSSKSSPKRKRSGSSVSVSTPVLDAKAKAFRKNALMISRGEIKDAADLQREVSLMCANAILYNGPADEISSMAKEIEAFADREIRALRYYGGNLTDFSETLGTGRRGSLASAASQSSPRLGTFREPEALTDSEVKTGEKDAPQDDDVSRATEEESDLDELATATVATTTTAVRKKAAPKKIGAKTRSKTRRKRK
ncbi:MAG: hypothetical protein SGCHY_001291 [Lobulomycetales sp.]